MRNVLYVPLDDRPVNLDDVVMLGRSAGINVLTPHRRDIRNRLDTKADANDSIMLSTSSPVYGCTVNIRQFILDHASRVDGFVISTDMLAYGGLIGSRRLRGSGGGSYPEYDEQTTWLLDVIRLVKEAYPGKPVFVLDTIMRLATTTYVEGLDYEAYRESRALMQQPRRPFSRFEDILEGYDLSPGSSYGETQHFDKEQYYNARRHKFKTNRYVLEKLAKSGYIDFLAVGVDDSSTQGVQANEISYLEAGINEWLGGAGGQNPDRAIILPDADGLGHALMARMASKLYRCGDKPRYAVVYYGVDGAEIINPYEYMNAHENIRRHVEIVGGELVTEAHDVEIIAVTNADQSANAVMRMETNGVNRVPTIVIDFAAKGPSNKEVTDALLDSHFTGRLLGYSGWNTAGNKIGIAVGMGEARHAFLTAERNPAILQKAVQAHGSLLFKRFLKDYYYKAVAISEIRAYSRSHSRYENTDAIADQNMELFNSEEDYSTLQELLRDLMQRYTEVLAGRNAFSIGTKNASCNIRHISSSGWSYAQYVKAVLPRNNPDFTWGRAFEITLSPEVKLH
ncbi:hypothetical protein DNH61_09325 [Paenibacillus sambharensis]|uniref:DUF4127 domain-containing protein n=1 Tax=Paenibacillus sambharensis TaxID=1803190 RepID=A0A2W1LMJ0_9BACL|nr:DUF4127 family protein [Paenibacillus sambharensis]PZD96105.1 hypothetical protein DNH61_09325 [Paenibacillus sambharensis]